MSLKILVSLESISIQKVVLILWSDSSLFLVFGFAYTRSATVNTRLSRDYVGVCCAKCSFILVKPDDSTLRPMILLWILECSIAFPKVNFILCVLISCIQYSALVEVPF